MTDVREYLVFIGQTEDNLFVAYREQEPLFCFVCETEAEALELVKETLNDYNRRFKQQSARFQARPVPIQDMPAAHVIANSKAYKLEEAV